jgi:hypothetical protein
MDIRSGRIIRPVGEMERSMKLTPQGERVFLCTVFVCTVCVCLCTEGVCLLSVSL